MKGRKKLFIITTLALMYFGATQCTSDRLRAPNDNIQSIQLRWVQAYPDENWDQVVTGLQWSLSFLGASLPAEDWSKAIQRIDDRYFLLRLEQLGFSTSALAALNVIVTRLKSTDEYEQFGAIDLGRFLVLTLHSSWHYYKITQASPSLEQYLNERSGLSLDSFPILKSSIAQDQRMIRFHVSPTIEDIFFLAEETKELSLPDYQIDHLEVLDIMSNGQLRFALYDQLGQLLPAAPLASTAAGKPSKCLWCHEVNVQPLFQATPDLAGFMDSRNFQLLVDSSNQLLQAYRDALPTALQFSDKQAHTQSELLYISFMEPSLFRIANEWEMEVEAIGNLFLQLPTHIYGEFPFLGDLYSREQVDALAPYGSASVPASVREPGDEPNFFQ